jgi:hypothetical protein
MHHDVQNNRTQLNYKKIFLLFCFRNARRTQNQFFTSLFDTQTHHGCQRLIAMMNSNNGGTNNHDVCSDADDVVASESRTQGCCLSQQIYIDSGNDKKVLFLLSIGLNHNNEPLFSFEREPWSLLPKTFLRPRNNEYVHEIKRLENLFNIHPVPRPSNWTKVRTMDWLE